MIEPHDELETSTFPRKRRRLGERPNGIQQSTVEEWKLSIAIEEQQTPATDKPDAGRFESEGENHR